MTSIKQSEQNTIASIKQVTKNSIEEALAPHIAATEANTAALDEQRQTISALQASLEETQQTVKTLLSIPSIVEQMKESNQKIEHQTLADSETPAKGGKRRLSGDDSPTSTSKGSSDGRTSGTAKPDSKARRRSGIPHSKSSNVKFSPKNTIKPP